MERIDCRFGKSEGASPAQGKEDSYNENKQGHNNTKAERHIQAWRIGGQYPHSDGT